MHDILTIASFVAGSIWYVWPAFLISVGLGVLIQMLQMDDAIQRAFGVRVGWSIILATLVGAFSPFCAGTVVPVISGLLLSGVPLAPVMAFWIASPTMDPEIFTLSVATIGWPLTFTRLGATLVLSLAAGYLALLLTRQGWLGRHILRQRTRRQARTCSVSGACGAEPGAAPLPRQSTAHAPWWAELRDNLRHIDWRVFGREMAWQSWQLGRWLLLAFVIEALITLYVPQGAITGVLGAESRLAVPLAALIGVPLYLTNMSALPIVEGLLAQGMQPGAALAFLVAGSITTIPAMAAVWGIVRWRVFLLYLGIGMIGAAAIGWLTNLLFLGL